MNGFNGALDERQRLVETDDQLRRDDIIPQGLVWPVHPLGEPQHEVALMDALRYIKDVCDGGHVFDTFGTMDLKHVAIAGPGSDSPQELIREKRHGEFLVKHVDPRMPRKLT